MPHDSVTRTQTEFNLLWAEKNPELFVQSVKDFQLNTPVTHWRHYVDLGRIGFLTLTACRRKAPYDSITDYLADGRGNLFLKETGQYD